MEPNSAILHQFLSEKQRVYFYATNTDQNDTEWKTVSYRKKNKRQSKITSPDQILSDRKADVIQQHSQDRRLKIIASQLPTADDGDIDAESPVEEDGNGEIKKIKVNKPKKPKITVAEAARKMDVDHLEAYLIDITAINERQQDVKLMQFADYFGQAFSSVNSAQFPWLKIFREASVHQMVDIPLAHISEDLYKTSVNWIGLQSHEALGSFVVWLSDKIFADISHRAVAKGSKKARQKLPSKSLVAIFVILAMVLRRKPDVLINLLPMLRENPKYQAEDNLPVTIWMIAQASQGDLVVGLYMWTRFLLPMLSGKSSHNSQSAELILQLVERILSSPKSRPILLSRAVRKRDRLVPPSALDLLMRISFPASSARVKATERFEAIYPTLKDIALSGGSGREAMKQVTEEILNFAIREARKGVPDLSREASNIFIWCLTQIPECYKQWDMLYLDNLEASVIILKRLSVELKMESVKDSTHESLKETLKSFRQKNAKALRKPEDCGRQATLREADKWCKAITRQLSKSRGCMKRMLIMYAAVSVGAAILSLTILSWNL